MARMGAAEVELVEVEVVEVEVEVVEVVKVEEDMMELGQLADWVVQGPYLPLAVIQIKN